jgi:hypothetical protein
LAAFTTPRTTGNSVLRGGRMAAGDVEVVLEQVGGLDGALVAGVDEDDALALQAGDGHRRHGLRRGGQQGGHLRSGLRALARPARRLPDIGVGDGDRTLGLLRHLVEQRGLLGAGDREGPLILQGGLEAVDLAAAQVACRGHAGASAAFADGLRIGRHRALAGADQEFVDWGSH